MSHAPTITLVIRLKDKTMATIETLGCKVGFRNVDYSGGVLTINGNPTTIRGVVRGEMFTDNKFPTPETMRKEVELMKANNINAVRIAYAPQTPYFYDLCDEYGIYVTGKNYKEYVENGREYIEDDCPEYIYFIR